MASIFDHSQTFEEFAAEQRRRGQTIVRTLDQIFRLTVIAVGSSVIVATPVRDGHARNNWLTSAGAPASGTPNPGEAAGTKAMDQLINTGVALKVDDTAYIVNNLPYIRRLNAGHSKQAPAGFIEKAMEAGHETVRKSNPLSFPASGDSNS